MDREQLTETGEDLLIRRYLLGAVEGEERDRLEKQMFADREYFNRVLMVEEELVEDFVFDTLSPDERKRFVEHMFSSPQQTEKVNDARRLKEYSERIGSEAVSYENVFLTFLRQRKWVASLSVAAMLLIVGFVGYWVITRNSLQREVTLLNQLGSDGKLALDATDYQINIAQSRTRVVSEVPTIAEQIISIPAGKHIVRLIVQLPPEEYSEYDVALQRSEGSEEVRLFFLASLKADNRENGKFLTVRVPAKTLVPGYYQLRLNGKTPNGKIEYLGSYVFHIA